MTESVTLSGRGKFQGSSRKSGQSLDQGRHVRMVEFPPADGAIADSALLIQQIGGRQSLHLELLRNPAFTIEKDRKRGLQAQTPGELEHQVRVFELVTATTTSPRALPQASMTTRYEGRSAENEPAQSRLRCFISTGLPCASTP